VTRLERYRPDGPDTLNPVNKALVSKLSLPFKIIWTLLVFSIPVQVGSQVIRTVQSDVISCATFLGAMLLIGWGWYMLTKWTGRLLKRFIAIRVDDPEIIMDKARLQRGDSFRIRYRQRFKRQVALQGITMRLICREWVEYDCGSDSTCHDSYEEIYKELNESATTIEAGQRLKKQASFMIPADAMHNLNERHNRLQWLLTVRIKMNIWPDFYEEYALKFTPEQSV
jgi:hypothetical protein